MNYQKILQDVYLEAKSFPQIGNVAQTIPQLSTIDPDKFGIHLTTIKGQDFGIGDSNEKFSIQSVSKALTVALAFSFMEKKSGKE